jgi:hypothetical protein
MVAGRGQRVGRIKGQVPGGRHRLKGTIYSIGKLYRKMD